jgi:hypothetical protein
MANVDSKVMWQRKMKRWDEEYAVQAFTEFLRGVDPLTQIDWEDVNKADEPPDYYLRWRQRFAVEVTSVMDEKFLDGKPFTSAQVTHDLASFCEDLEREARKQEILRGTYRLAMEPVASLSRMRKSIRGAVFEYLGRTQKLAKAEEIEIGPHQEFSLEKLRQGKDVIYPAIVGWKSGADIPGDLHRHLGDALAKKRHKLREVAEPRILLIFDRYGFGNPQNWWSAARSVSFSGFHTVARVWIEKTVQILVTEEEAWLRKATSPACSGHLSLRPGAR